MLDGSIMEFIKWWIYLILMFGALALFMFFFQVGQTNRFDSFVSSQIEREAGLTPAAKAAIKLENEQYYGGRYTVVLDTTAPTKPDANGLFRYGDVVKYQINGAYEIMFTNIFPIGPVDMQTDGQATVQVRGNAG